MVRFHRGTVQDDFWFCDARCPLLDALYKQIITLKKLECSKQAYALNTLAWNNTIGLWPILLVCRTGVMIKRDSRGHSYSVARGEILRFAEDELMRKHLPRMFSLIKNESWGLEDD